MGRRYRGRNYRQEDDFNPNFIHQSSNRWNERPDNRTSYEDVQPGRYRVARWEGHNNSNRNRNPFRPEPTNHQQPNDSFPANHPNATGNLFQSQSFPPQFPVGSKYFKEYLITSINQILSQINQWCPDEETLDTDGMDWQPELEVIIPQPRVEIHYAWGSTSLTNDSVLGDDDGIDIKRRARCDELILGKKKTASEGHLGSGCGSRLFDGTERKMKWDMNGGFDVPRSRREMDAY